MVTKIRLAAQPKLGHVVGYLPGVMWQQTGGTGGPTVDDLRRATQVLQDNHVPPAPDGYYYVWVPGDTVQRFTRGCAGWDVKQRVRRVRRHTRQRARRLLPKRR